LDGGLNEGRPCQCEGGASRSVDGVPVPGSDIPGIVSRAVIAGVRMRTAGGRIQGDAEFDGQEFLERARG
jgi:hypothetical protein